ncbi:hypothetical protein PA08_1593 [Cutibacterium modestum P08]|nr:hypothetical protein PA08_1593 [Cutibacterium modestum P08]
MRCSHGSCPFLPSYKDCPAPLPKVNKGAHNTIPEILLGPFHKFDGNLSETFSLKIISFSMKI